MLAFRTSAPIRPISSDASTKMSLKTSVKSSKWAISNRDRVISEALPNSLAWLSKPSAIALPSSSGSTSA